MNVLIIEDNPCDAELVKLELRKMGISSIDHFLNVDSCREKYVPGKYDVILCDYNLGEKFGTEILIDIRATDSTIPFIFVSGAIGEENAIEILKLGATDYVLKNNLGKLALVIHRALKEVETKLKEKNAFEALRASEEKYRLLVENMNESVFLSDETGKLLFLNQQFCKTTGYSYDELIGKNGYEFLAPEKNKAGLINKIHSRQSGISETYQSELLRKNGEILIVRNSASPVFENGKFIGVMSVMSDITNEKKQEKLMQSIHNSLGVATGDNYFSELTDYLCKSFNIKIALIGTYLPDERAVQTISIRINGKPVENMKYGLENTPCKNVVEKTVCIYPEKVQELFPLDTDLVKLNAQSYIGAPLFSSDRKGSGLIVLIDDKPMEDIEEMDLVLSMVASRAGAELERNKIENSLIESELKYRNVVEDQTEYIYRWLPGGEIVFANRSFLNFHGTTIEEIQKKKIFDLIPPHEIERVKKKIARLNPADAVSTDIHHSVHPKKGLYWHEWTDRAFFDGKGNVLNYQSIGRDITIEKLAENKLAENESRFRMLVENSYDIYSICDENGIITYCSPNVKHILGYEPGEIINSSAFDFFHSSFSLDAKEKFRKLFDSSNDHHVFIHKILSAKNEFRVFQTTGKVLSGKTGERTIIFNSNDITEKHYAEKKLKETAAILDLVDSLVVVVNPDTEVKYVSPSVKKMLGYEPAELMGKMWWEKTTPGHIFMQKEIDRVKRIFAGGLNEENNYYERLIQTKDGQLKWVAWKKSMTPDGSIIGVGQDITKKKKTEQELERSQKYLSTLVESIPDLLFHINSDGKIIDYKTNNGGNSELEIDGNLKGYDYQKLIPQNIHALHKQCVSEALASGKIVTYDFELIMPSASSKYYETRIKGNAANELVLIVRDITNKREQEHIIYDKEQKLNEAQKIAMIGSWHLDILNNVLDWTDETCRIFGVEPGTKSNLEKFLSIVHPEDREYVSEKWAAALRNEKYDIEHRIIVDGKIKWVREIASLEINSDGVVTGGLGTAQDITAKKLSETKLIKREKLLSFSHKLSKTGYFTWNLDKNILSWSEELYAIFEKNANSDSPSFDAFFNLIHPEDILHARKFHDSLSERDRAATIDFRIITDNGTEKYLRKTTDITTDEFGEKVIIGVIQDITEIKDFENALLQRERQIQRSNKLNTQIIETSDQFFYVSRVKHPEMSGNSLTYVSPQVEDLFGISPTVFINDITIWHKAIHPDDFELMKRESMKMYLIKKPLSLIYRIKNQKNENYYWVEDYVCPQFDGNGEIVELYGSVKNIDERKKAEEEIYKREKLLSEAQRIAKLGAWELDLNTQKITLNDEMNRILEIEAGDFDGKVQDLLTYLSPESIPRFQEAITNAVTNYKSEDIELKIITAKGNIRKLVVRGSEQREILKDRIVAHGTVLDITEIWQSHEALFETEEKFKKIFETITDVYYQADMNGTCTIASPSCFSVLGYHQEELVGIQISSLYEFPENRIKMLEILNRDGLIKGFEASLLAKDGKCVYVSTNISFIYDHDGKPIGIQGIVRDITEKRKNELEREKLIIELTNKYNQLMQFNYIVSHNLRSPITNLLGLSNMFEGKINAEEQETIVKHIRNSVLSMDMLVKDLNMILATRTAINENKEEVLLTAVFETIKNNLHAQISDSAAMLISDVGDDNNKLYTIKSYFQSILYNLVNNSIKYRAVDRKPVIRISCMREETQTCIKVIDNGNGIDLSKFGDQLFGLYKRFDFTKEGKGLGLHMTKTQVEALGGEIFVESELGKGTTFTITLPN